MQHCSEEEKWAVLEAKINVALLGRREMGSARSKNECSTAREKRNEQCKKQKWMQHCSEEERWAVLERKMKLVLLVSRKISLLNCVFLAGCGFCIIEGSKINNFDLSGWSWRVISEDNLAKDRQRFNEQKVKSEYYFWSWLLKLPPVAYSSPELSTLRGAWPHCGQAPYSLYR